MTPTSGAFSPRVERGGGTDARPFGRQLLNKVPEITLVFWLIKVLCTTVGETAADYLNLGHGFGLANTTYVAGALLAVLLVVQFRARRYVAPLYWSVVVVISVFGTLITDTLSDTYDVPLVTSTALFTAILLAVFAIWFACERTLSIRAVTTTRREAFYWLAILFTFALGTAAGDLMAERFALGYAASVAVFGALIALVAFARYALELDPLVAFWLAYVLTRPLGAAFGDELSQHSESFGGLGLGATGTSYVFLAAIFALVTYLQVTKRDRTPTRKVLAGPG